MLIKIVGAGLAGSEAALTLAEMGYEVELFEQKPQFFSAAHKLTGAAELVCSNSLKSEELGSAHGLLKHELRLLGSPLLEISDHARLPGGKALTIEREKFSKLVTERLEAHPRISFRKEKLDRIPEGAKVLIASGPLTSPELSDDIKKHFGGEHLYFYDATSPVVSLESLDLSKFFWANRNQDGDDYLNLPLTKEAYEAFWNEIQKAEKVEAHLPEEKLQFFEGCLPIEEIARRGIQTLACSAMKPSGFGDRCPAETYAVIQFRRERAAGELLSMVGFQSRMKWPEQIRIFRSLPGMENAEFMRLGSMHRNTFINTPAHLNDRLEAKNRSGLHFAGQITGSEGYSEAIATGHYAALMMAEMPILPEVTAIRSLVRFLVASDPRHFQPMNFNFGLLPPQSGGNKKSVGGKIYRSRKAARAVAHAERSISELMVWGESHKETLGTLWKGGSTPSFARAL